MTDEPIDYEYPDEAEPEYVEIDDDELAAVTRSATSTAPDPSRYKIPGGGTLRGDAAASYLRMRAAGMPAGGVAVFYRSLAQQEILYKRHLAWLNGTGPWAPLAARPNANAPHVRGVAMDLQTTASNGSYAPSAAHRWLTKGGNGQYPPTAGEKLQAHAYGWRRTVRSERWHFGYEPARDKHRAAALAAELKARGYKNLATLQEANGLTLDGVDGPITWKWLLSNPTPKPGPPKVSTSVKFHFGQANLQAERFGGLDSDSAARGKFLKAKLPASIMALCEVPEEARDAIRKFTGHKVWTVGYVCVSWSPKKWQYSKPQTVSFGTPYHGAVRVTLTDLQGSGLELDVISLHIRPAVSFPGDEADKLAGKLRDVSKALTLVRPGKNTIIAGDWNTKHHAELLIAAGFTRVTSDAEAIDAVWIRGDLAAIKATLVDPGPVSDHNTWDVYLRLSRPVSPL